MESVNGKMVLILGLIALILISSMWYLVYANVRGKLQEFDQNPNVVMEEMILNLKKFIILISLVVLILMIIGIGFVSGKFVNEITEIVEYSEDMADSIKGRKISQTTLSRDDEIGRLGRALSKVNDNIERIVRKIEIVSKEAIDSSQDLSNVINTSLISIDEVSEALSDMTIKIEDQAKESYEGKKRVIDLYIMIDDQKMYMGELESGAKDINEINLKGEDILSVLLEQTGESSTQ